MPKEQYKFYWKKSKSTFFRTRDKAYYVIKNLNRLNKPMSARLKLSNKNETESLIARARG